MGEVNYEVHMTRVLHPARISNVDTVMFVNRIREMVNFELHKGIEHRSAESEGLRFDFSWRIRIFFLCHTLVARRKTSFSLKKASTVQFLSKRATYH